MIQQHLAWRKHITIDILKLLHLCHEPISTIDIDKTKWSCSTRKLIHRYTEIYLLAWKQLRKQKLTIVCIQKIVHIKTN